MNHVTSQSAFASVCTLANLPQPSLHEILHRVSEVTRVPVRVICSPERDMRTVYARHIFSWLARHRTSKTYPQIGRVVQRNHTSILNGVEKVDAGFDTYARDIAAIETLLEREP